MVVDHNLFCRRFTYGIRQSVDPCNVIEVKTEYEVGIGNQVMDAVSVAGSGNYFAYAGQELQASRSAVSCDYSCVFPKGL